MTAAQTDIDESSSLDSISFNAKDSNLAHDRAASVALLSYSTYIDGVDPKVALEAAVYSLLRKVGGYKRGLSMLDRVRAQEQEKFL